MKKNPQSLQDLDEKWKNYDFTNAIGLLLLMQQIQEQRPHKYPGAITFADDGTPIY